MEHQADDQAFLMLNAVREGNAVAVESMLEQNPGLSTCIYRFSDEEASHRTFLMDAATSGNINVARLLIDKGANVNASDGGGDTPLHYAACEGHEEMVAFLLGKGADPSNALTGAVIHGHLEITRMLIDAGADIYHVDDLGETAFHCAASQCHEEIVALLVSRGAGIDINSFNYGDNGDDCKTPLMLTATSSADSNRRMAVLEMLFDIEDINIDAIADNSEEDYAGETALFKACRQGHADVVRALLCAGADEDIVSEADKTAEDIAEECGHQNCVDVFQWLEDERMRDYVIHRARHIYDAHTNHDRFQYIQVPVYLRKRMTAGAPLPSVTVVQHGQPNEQELVETTRWIIQEMQPEIFVEFMESCYV